jgi:hypothetical protein
MRGAEGETIIYNCVVFVCVCVPSPVHDCFSCRCSYARDLHPPVHCCASRGRPSRSKSRTHLHGTYPQCTTLQHPLTQHAPRDSPAIHLTTTLTDTQNMEHCYNNMHVTYPQCTTLQHRLPTMHHATTLLSSEREGRIPKCLTLKK